MNVTQNEYVFSFDLVQVSQLIIVLSTVLVLFFLKDRLHKNKYAFILCILLILGVCNSYLLKFTTLQVPNLSVLFVLFAGPTLLYHVKEYHIVSYSIKNTYFLHLGVSTLIFLPSLFFQSARGEFLFAVCAIIHFGFYLVQSLHVLVTKKVVAVTHSSEEYNILSKRWKRDFYFLLAVVCVYLTVIFESFFVEIKMLYRYTYIMMFVTIAVLSIRLVFVKARDIYRYYQERNNSKKIAKYKDSILTKTESKLLFDQLETIMKQHRPYLEEDLNLQMLANRLKTHPKHLSQSINENFLSNYFDYINSYRIELAKKMLLDPFYRDYKVYEIMYETGFNSRSSFNTAFKKYTGLTPKMYKEQNQ